MNQLQLLSQEIEKSKKQNTYRKLINCQNLPNNQIMIGDKKYISFCSNDYLSLGFDPDLITAIKNTISQHNIGGLSSRYISGNNKLYQKLEKKIAKINKQDDAIVFGSGYLANIGVIPAIFNKNDLILADKLSHSCLIDGSLLSKAKFIRFAHNNLDSLTSLLQKYRKNHQKCLIISETIFSMDGDLGKIDDIISVAKNYNSFILSDNAHGLGVINQKYQKYDLHLKSGTFSKSVAGYGGYITAHQIIIDYLKNFTKSVIYSTALPPMILASNLKALSKIEEGSLTKKLWQNIDYFCNLINIKNQESAIIAIIIGNNQKTLEVAEKLKKQGFIVSAIRPPTVAIGKSRLRITINASHNKSDLKLLAENLKNLL